MSPRSIAPCAICLCILAIVGCGSRDHSKVELNSPPVVENQQPNEEVNPVSPPVTFDRQTLDEQVIEAALCDLVTSEDEDSMTLRREQGRGRLLFSGTSRDWGSAHPEAWKSLAPSDRDAADAAAFMVTWRVKNMEGFSPFRPSDSRIFLWEDDPASRQTIDPLESARPRPIYAAPPGYGDQNRLAVVVFSFAWSIHGGVATYVLRFDGRNWTVISRLFLYYV
jgi:hypothetical protein